LQEQLYGNSDWLKLYFKEAALIACANNNDAELKRLLARKFIDITTRAPKTREHLIHVAAYYKSSGVVKALLEREADVNAELEDGKTALHIAVYNEDKKLVSILAKHGANAQYADKKGLTPKDIARLRNLKKIEMLLDTMDIHSKARVGDVEGVRDALLEGCEAGWINPKTGTTPLYNAVHKGHYDVAALILSTKVDPDLAPKDGLTPLYSAANRGALDIIELLLSHNADPGRCLGTGMSPLMVAIRKNHWKAAAILLEAGADVHQANGKGLTPLMMALEMNSREGVDLLIEYDADVNELSADGVPLLHKLCQRSGLKQDSISLYLEYGGVIDIIDEQHNLSALHTVVMHRRDRRADKTIEALVKYGIPVNVLCGAPEATLKTPLAALCECDEAEYKSNNERKIAYNALASITTMLIESKADPLVRTSNDSQYALTYASTLESKRAVTDAAKKILAQDILAKLYGVGSVGEENNVTASSSQLHNDITEHQHSSLVSDGSEGKKSQRQQRQRRGKSVFIPASYRPALPEGNPTCPPLPGVPAPTLNAESREQKRGRSVMISRMTLTGTIKRGMSIF
ncbi:hypothetical protein FOZ62_028240, partial [Perkinsus olseni]